MEPYVFLSYARRDEQMALTVLRALGEADVRIWYDRGIEGGVDWAERIEERLRNCTVLCALLSESAVDSEYVRKEIHLAVDTRKPIVPARLDDVELGRGLALLLGGRQILDFRVNGFSGELTQALTAWINPGGRRVG
jgi:hypothetical protein